MSYIRQHTYRPSNLGVNLCLAEGRPDNEGQVHLGEYSRFLQVHAHVQIVSEHEYGATLLQHEEMSGSDPETDQECYIDTSEKTSLEAYTSQSYR